MNWPLKPSQSAVVRLPSLLLLLLGLSWGPSAKAQSYLLTNLWSITPRTNTFLNNDNLSRGIAYNPVTGHLLVVSRTAVPDFGTNVFGTNAVYILDSTNGAVLGTLPYDTNVINGGTFPINMIGVTEDGVIYVGNLVTALAAGPFKLYRWVDETAQPQLAYSGDPSGGIIFGTSPQRFGDSLALRGTGAGTQILLGTYNQTIGLLRTTDGMNFTATLLVTGIAASDSRLGLAWGSGDTFWIKQGSGGLRKLGLDPVANTATILTNIALTGATVAPGWPLGVDLNRNLVAIIDPVGHVLRVYDVLDPSNPIQQDTAKSFPTSVANGNGTGAVIFRDGKLFALESNNGILALALGETTLPATVAIQPSSVTVWKVRLIRSAHTMEALVRSRISGGLPERTFLAQPRRA